MVSLDNGNPSFMIRLSLLFIIMLASFFHVRGQCASPCSSFFVHQAVSTNISRNWTVITNPLTDGNPNAILLVTPVWGGRYPPAVLSIYNHPIGVWYTGTKWAIFNQDLAAMSFYADFNVQVLNACPSVFVHRANTSSNITTIDHPLANNNPNALLFVTQNWNPGGGGGVYNNHRIGVYYNGNRWTIFNQDSVAMPAGASFNVAIRNPGPTAFVHRATLSNTWWFFTQTNNPIINSSARAILMVTPNRNPPGSPGVYFNRNFGLVYYGGGWTISTQDNANMTIGPAFNVEVIAPRANNKIVFVSTRDGLMNTEIYLMNPDGSDQRRLTNNSWLDNGPAISPNGTKIAFVSQRSGDSHAQIYLMNANGTEQTRLTSDPAVVSELAWSPDGRKIAFESSSHIFIIDAVPGSVARRITSGDDLNRAPTWSPDGTRIAFVTATRRDSGSMYIHIINADGTGEVNITSRPSQYETPDWSPDGTKFTFAKYEGSSSEIFVMNADGSGETRLTNDTWIDRNPRWSGDGAQIVFESWRETTQIWTMCIDGSRQTQRTYPPRDNRYPDW